MISTIYRKDSGEIVFTMRGSERDCFDTLRGYGVSTHSYIECGSDPDLHYVDVAADELRDRQPFDLTIMGNVVSGIPEGTEIMLPNRTWVVADATGSIELEVDHAQTAELRLRHPRFLATEITVDCTP